MDRVNKKKLVAGYSKVFADHDSLFFVTNSGLSVLDARLIRLQFDKIESRFLFVKNSLMKIALADSRFSDISDTLSGPVILIASNDPISTSKLLVKLCNNSSKIKLMAAAAFGEHLSEDGIISLSKMPSQEEIRARIACLVSAAASKIITTLNEPGRQLLRVIKHYSKK